MATIRKRGTKWQVQIRRVGHPPISKTFLAKDDALRWSRERERAVDRGEVCQPAVSDKPRTYLSEILDRYEQEVSTNKRSPSDQYHLRPIKSFMEQVSISDLSPAHLAAFREARLLSVSSSTVRKEMNLFCSVLSIARLEWGETIDVEAFRRVRKPPSAKGRERRLEAHECPALVEAIQNRQNPLAGQVFQFALATGMRRGEVLSLKWSNVDLQSRVALLPLTKNGEARRVPLSSSAMQVLQDRLKATQWTPESLLGASCEPVFPISANAVRLAWERARRKAGIKDLRFHDLRHEAISRFFEMGLSVPEVALISGHKDARMLFRYTQLRAENVAKKLSGEL